MKSISDQENCSFWLFRHLSFQPEDPQIRRRALRQWLRCVVNSEKQTSVPHWIVGEPTATDARRECFHSFKAAVINIFMLTTDQMTACNVKVIARTDKPIETHRPALLFASVPLSLLASVGSLFWFSWTQTTLLFPPNSRQTNLSTGKSTWQQLKRQIFFLGGGDKNRA